MLYIGQQFPFDLIRLSVTGPPPISSVPYCSVATELSWHVVLVPSCSTANCNRLANQLTSSYDVPSYNNAVNSWHATGMSRNVQFQLREHVVADLRCPVDYWWLG